MTLNAAERLSRFDDAVESPDVPDWLKEACRDQARLLRRQVVPRKSLPKESKKRKAERVKRAECRRIVLDRDVFCVVCTKIGGLSSWTADRSTDVHELINRSQGGDYLNPDECVGLCRFHHQQVTDNPEWAHEIGLTKWGWEKGRSSKILPRREERA